MQKMYLYNNKSIITREKKKDCARALKGKRRS